MLTCADDSRIRVTLGKDHAYLYLVLGNSPGELVCDYSAGEGEVCEIVDRVVCEHSEQWDKF